MRSNGVNCSAPTALDLGCRTARRRRPRPFSTMSSSVIVSLLSTSLRSGSSSCHSSRSTFSRPARSHCSSTLSAGTYWRTRSVNAPAAQRWRSARSSDVGVEDVVALLVDHLALVVGDVVVLEQLLADVEVARLDLALRALDAARDDAGFDRLAVGHLQPLHDRAHAVAGEDAHQRIVQRQVEARGARVALAAGAAAQLVVDAARLRGARWR